MTDGDGMQEQARTDLLLPITSSEAESPFNFLLRDCGLEAREHSEPAIWQRTHTSSSSLMMQLAREYRHEMHGRNGEPLKEAWSVDAELAAGRLPWPISSLWKLSWR